MRYLHPSRFFPVTLSKPIGTILVLLSIFLFSQPAQAKYGGGSGTAEDPYRIATEADLTLLSNSPADYDKHFILIHDIDLAGYVFDKAVIAPDGDPIKSAFQGTPFTGVFDGNGHTISHLKIKGGDFVGLFGRLGGEVKNLGTVDVNMAASDDCVGGLVGSNSGALTHCYSMGVVDANECVGGLVGLNSDGGSVTQCYSTGVANGTAFVGGLIGADFGGTIVQCYSRNAVSGTRAVGGLLGAWGPVPNTVSNCFWDTQTSGQTESAGGTGKTTAEMQRGKTFLQAG